ncbi:hypothetical protein [Paenibacillus senegalensis]|uniref:hypothetical protein n=1 Tax=Paenibacillus senegalensis TaxID=1465766 RepID=UPI000289C8F7|nr:hypothetical protein [Paenibacillus senegalensis]
MVGDQLDFDYLQARYRITLRDVENTLFTATLKDLLDQRHMERFVHFFVPLWKAKGPIVAAAYLGSWLGTLCSAMQESMSRYDAIPVMTLERLTLQVYEEDGRRRCAFRLADSTMDEAPSKERAIWRNIRLESFYGELIKPLLQSAAHATGAPLRDLWGQFVTRMYNEQERWLRETESEQRKELIRDDFEALRIGLQPSVFGIPKNPFNVKIRWIDSPHVQGESIRMRSSCCHAYYTETDHGYCYSCPRMREEEREVKKRAMLAANG